MPVLVFLLIDHYEELKVQVKLLYSLRWKHFRSSFLCSTHRARTLLKSGTIFVIFRLQTASLILLTFHNRRRLFLTDSRSMDGILLKKKKLGTLNKVEPDACYVRAIIQYPHPKHLERAQHRNDTNVVNHR